MITEYLKYENLMYGIKEDSVVCVKCYNKNMKILVEHSDILKNKQKEVFIGLGDDQIQREMGFYNKLRLYEEHAKHLYDDNLREWFALMKENAEEPVVACNHCGKEFKNNVHARFYVGDDKYYACSGDCKGRIAEKARSEKKKEKQKQQLDQTLEKFAKRPVNSKADNPEMPEKDLCKEAKAWLAR